MPVKGKTEPMDVYLLANDRRGLTDYQPPLHTKMSSCGSACATGSQSRAVDVQAGACLIGRDDDCRIKIEHRLVSRRHASIECVAGKFFLQDHSTNGTYVAGATAGQARARPPRDLQLKASGVISLGIEPQHNVEHSIFFSFEK